MNTKDKTIFRTIKDKDNPYVMMDKRPTENPGLSWKAKGILSYLLSRPDNWDVRMGDLVKRALDKEHATRSGINELIKAGHIQRIYEREKGKIKRVILEVYEQPLRGFQQVEKPQVENLDVENHPLTNTDPSNTDHNNTEESAPVGAQPTGTNGLMSALEWLESQKGGAWETEKIAEAIKRANESLAAYNTETFAGISLREKSEKQPTPLSPIDVAFAKWEAYRKEIRKPLKETTRKMQWLFLLQNEKDAVAIMEQSMLNGWAGLFPLKQNGHAPKPAQPTPALPSEEELNRQRADVAAKVAERNAKRKAGIKDQEEIEF